jgi:hypothetical protein
MTGPQVDYGAVYRQLPVPVLVLTPDFAGSGRGVEEDAYLAEPIQSHYASGAGSSSSRTSSRTASARTNGQTGRPASAASSVRSLTVSVTASAALSASRLTVAVHRDGSLPALTLPL